MTQVTIQQALQLGVEHHQAGRLAEAEAIYRQVLDVHPEHPDALHLLGLLAASARQFESAVELIQRAIASNPNVGVYYSNLAGFLRELGRRDDGMAAARKAIALEPNRAEAHNNLANVSLDQGDIDQAVTSYRRAIAINPNYSEAFANLGTALSKKKEYHAAIGCLQRAVELNPNFAEGFNNLGVALRALERKDEALAAYRRAVELGFNNATAHFNLATILREKGAIDASIEHYRRALAIRPAYAEAHSNLGNALMAKSEFEEAYRSYQRAIELRPDYAEAHYNLGTMQQTMGQIDQAIASLRRALQFQPDLAEAHVNLGTAIHEQGQFSEAIDAFRKAMSPNPSFAAAHWNLALALLLTGNFEEGLKEYEWRWLRAENLPNRREFTEPRWNGEDLAGKTILVYCEQGLGDSLQFVRYLPMLEAHGANVVLECEPDLVRILRPCKGVHRIVPKGEPLPAFDYQISLLSLPLAFKTTLATIPNDVPYLKIDDELIERWRARLSTFGTSIKVGLVWSGNPDVRQNQKRSIALEQFAPLATIKGVKWISLQKGKAAEQVMSPPAGMDLIDFTNELHDFVDTAGLIMNLDLVISVDTAVAHLAGALNKQVWTLLPFVPDWRWQLDRGDSPWYPTMTLFRQVALGDWNHVMERVRHELITTRQAFSSRDTR